MATRGIAIKYKLLYPLLFLFLLLSLTLPLLFSCQEANKVKPAIKERSLFSLEYGNFEEEINLFSLQDIGDVSTCLAMQDGFFYIVNGEAQKIMNLTSYGDLLNIYYNEEFYKENNPGLPSNSSKNIWHSTNIKESFTGQVAVNSKKDLYAVVKVDNNKAEEDKDAGLVCSYLVLCIPSSFASNIEDPSLNTLEEEGKEAISERKAVRGGSTYLIGQEGQGGGPFPYIKNIYTTRTGYLVVVSVTNTGLLSFWYKDAVLRYKIPIEKSSLPQEKDSFLSIENAVPSYNNMTLYIKVDYYKPHIDHQSKVQSGIDYTHSSVYALDIEDAEYKNIIDVPPYFEDIVGEFNKVSYALPYDFIGITKTGWLFFMITTTEGFAIEAIDSASNTVIKRALNANHDNILYYKMHLSDAGIVSALIAYKEKVDIVWWRTDELIDAIFK